MKQQVIIFNKLLKNHKKEPTSIVDEMPSVPRYKY